jgi:hypothetical protein
MNRFWDQEPTSKRSIIYSVFSFMVMMAYRTLADLIEASPRAEENPNGCLRDHFKGPKNWFLNDRG